MIRGLATFSETFLLLLRFPIITLNEPTDTQRILIAPEDATPGWLTAVLHRNAVATETQVSAVEVTLRKELPISTVCRLGITYADPVDENSPPSLFLKLPRVGTQGPVSDDHAEVEFYQTCASMIGCPPLIRCYDAAATLVRSHILLEDLTETHSQPEQERAPSEEMSRQAVKALAKSHAACWGTVISDLGCGMSDFRHDKASYRGDPFDLEKFTENLNRTVTEFLNVADVTVAHGREYRRMLDAADEIWGRLTRQEHVTVTHGDMHWWNFLYPKDANADDVRLFDWHLWHIDLGARDLAFLLALGGFAEPRPSLEEDLLRVYHNALGVKSYSWEMLLEDYRWSAIRNLNIPVIFWSQGKHYSTWQTALRRAFDAYERLECGALVR